MFYLYSEFIRSRNENQSMTMNRFAQFLRETYSWSILASADSGARQCDRYVVSSPSGERFELVDWADGGSGISTVGGVKVLTDGQLLEIRREAELMYIGNDEESRLRRRLEDALRKTPNIRHMLAHAAACGLIKIKL